MFDTIKIVLDVLAIVGNIAVITLVLKNLKNEDE